MNMAKEVKQRLLREAFEAGCDAGTEYDFHHGEERWAAFRDAQFNIFMEYVARTAEGGEG